MCAIKKSKDEKKAEDTKKNKEKRNLGFPGELAPLKVNHGLQQVPEGNVRPQHRFELQQRP